MGVDGFSLIVDENRIWKHRGLVTFLEKCHPAANSKEGWDQTVSKQLGPQLLRNQRIGRNNVFLGILYFMTFYFHSQDLYFVLFTLEKHTGYIWVGA